MGARGGSARWPMHMQAACAHSGRPPLRPLPSTDFQAAEDASHTKWPAHTDPHEVSSAGARLWGLANHTTHPPTQQAARRKLEHREWPHQLQQSLLQPKPNCNPAHPPPPCLRRPQPACRRGQAARPGAARAGAPAAAAVAAATAGAPVIVLFTQCPVTLVELTWCLERAVHRLEETASFWNCP